MVRIRLLVILVLSAIPVLSGFTGSPLGFESVMNQIIKEAPTKRIPPIDAKLDRVWGAIPGYNGLEADIEKTYEANKNNSRGSAIQYVFKEIPPAVNLSNLGAEPVYRGNPQKPMVAFMINVAWGDEFIPLILDTLDKHNVKATFFFDGSWLKKNIDTANKIASHGHELSNHAYSHKNMSQLSSSQALNEISKTEKLLQEQLHVKNRWFAPPSGDFDKKTVEIALSLKLNTVLWTLDTVDWQNPSPQSLVHKVEAKAENGFLILMHPTRSSSSALDGMIRALTRKGLHMGTVSEVLSPQRIPALQRAP
jgi:probable sporulation protein (polysaccharide deacetylase family)